jgi:Membrane bound beta barrel domain (DUF5777)
MIGGPPDLNTLASYPGAAAPSRLFRVTLTLIAIVAFLVTETRVAAAQALAPTSGAVVQAQPDDEDAVVIDPAEPDVVVVNLPTTMRMPLYKGNFRLMHRFAGNLRSGTFGQQASDLFGIDRGAIIGFEYRVAVAPGVQAAVYRSSFDKTVQLYGKYDAIRQRAGTPVSVSALVSVEGTDNFQEKFAPALGLVFSRTIARRVAVYASPIWVNNTAASLNAAGHGHGTDDPSTDAPHVHRRTTYVGLGTRMRVSSSTYLVGEMAPRLDGYAPDTMEYGFGLERRAGGHMFSLTFTNTFGSTFAQLARGGAVNTLYLGFNLSRKFF